jgi:hypothetical protein
MATIYQFTKQITEGPNGTVIGFKQTEGAEVQPLELCTIDGVTYLSVPTGYTLEDQPAGIDFTPAVLTESLKESIKANAHAVQLIAQDVQRKIREKYTLEDENYFARIGVGAALNAYTFLPGEKEALLAFNDYVEQCRRYGKEKRSELGL